MNRKQQDCWRTELAGFVGDHMEAKKKLYIPRYIMRLKQKKFLCH